MSFDLVVWYEPWPTTGHEARAKLDAAYERDDYSEFIAHPNVSAFHAALLERLPALESVDPPGGDASPWSVTPGASDRLIALCLLYSTPDSVFTVIFELVERFGLIMLDPQDNSLYLPGPPDPTYRLTASGRPALQDPAPDVVAHQVRTALTRGGHAILEREPQSYVQAGSGPDVGRRTRPGYAVEHRDGSADRHFRYETTDLDEVLAIFDDFKRGDASFRTRLSWRKYEP